MYRRLILLLAAITLIILGTSLAQETGNMLTGLTDMTGEGGQMVTEVDTGGIISSELDFTGTDNGQLSGEANIDIGSGTFTGESDSGSILEIIPDILPHLIISEVYFDGTDEWIEITNIGNGNFQGNLSLVGVKSTTLSLTNISLLVGESKIFGDNLTQVSENRFIGKTGLSLNLIDTSPINIQLSISGQVEDNFLVDAYRVDLYNDKKTSFEKISGISTRTTLGRVVNALSGYIINPGVYSVIENSFTDVSFPPTQSGSSIQLPISCVYLDQRDLIKVTEIFPGNESYPPYIELAIHDDLVIQSLSLSGNLLGTSVIFSRYTGGSTLEKNSILLISSTGFRQDQEEIPSVRNDDFSLVSTGNWLLITIGSGQNRRVMDIVYLSGNILGKSSYFQNTTLQCAHVLDSVDDFSPGFERKFLKYISGRTAPKIEYIYVNTGNQSTGIICPLSGAFGIFSGENQVNISGFRPENYTIRIVNVVYDPEGSDTNNEMLTLLATNLSGDTIPLDLNQTFRLKVNGINKTLPRILPMDTPTTFTKTFGFPNSTDDGKEVIIQLTYGEYIFDTYTYNPNIPKEQEILTGDIQTTGIILDLSGLQFSVTYVLPNPQGKDVIEEIGIQVDSQKSIITGINLSDIWYVKIGSKKKKIQGFLHVGQENILSGNLGLVNKAACVSLFYQEEELAKFCYRTPKEGEKIYSSDLGLEHTTQENLDILNMLQLKRIANQLCIRYKDQSFLCKRIPASKAEIKTVNEKNLYKGFSTLIKNYLMTDWRTVYYDTNIKTYFDMLSGNKKLIAQGISKVDIYGQRIPVTSIKQQLEVIENTPIVIITLFEGAKALLKD